jgi:hypothetical protein
MRCYGEFPFIYVHYSMAPIRVKVYDLLVEKEPRLSWNITAWILDPRGANSKSLKWFPKKILNNYIFQKGRKFAVRGHGK